MILKTYKGYRPNVEEEYMCERQLEFFRQNLLKRREELVNSTNSFIDNLKDVSLRKSDPIDQSASQAEISLDFQERFRQQECIAQIDAALSRMQEGEYGYCEITGEDIGIPRLLARPTATMCVEVQEHHERLNDRVGSSACYAY